ncbi:hypothetical protein FOFC_07888 [Fusarium oxysporum]|nr:hypothetical protein FOFC_09697 [Fusarium oxysporum]KAI8411294.1 hypothetical protein FOFC_07888 [Fusarium oxysporum]
MHSSANLRAAQAIVSARQRLLRGRIRDAAREATQPLTLRQAEERFPGSKRATIARIVKKLEAANSLNPEDLPDDRGGRPRLLTDDEEEAIVAFVVWMQKSGLPASKYEVEDAANTLRRRRDPDAKSVSRMWYRRFCDDHPELDKSILKAKEASRVEYEEAGVEETKQWFQRLTEVITNYKIGASECWNADQAGVREIFNEGFTRAHIISGFEKSGIFPPTDRPAVEFLLRKKLKAKKTVNPAFLSLLPSETRFTTASATAQRLRDRYHNILSSPTRQGLMHIQKIVNEAILLEKHVLENVNDRRTRIEKRYYERKRGKRAQGASDYINTISLQELREQQDEYVAESQKKSIRSEIRQQRSQLIRELEALKQEWRDNREVTVEGITKKLQFKKWLEVTGKKNDYLSMDTQRSAMTEALNEVTDGFMIDTQHPPDLRESIRNAAFAAKPLEAVDFSLLPHSDDSVTFHLTRPEETPCPSDFGSNSEVVMPSSPPCLPDYESPPQSSLPSVPSTPCPSQHQIQYRESLRDLI